MGRRINKGRNTTKLPEEWGKLFHQSQPFEEKHVLNRRDKTD